MKKKKILKWLGMVIVSPVMLFLLLAVLIYIPPVQNFVVHKVADTMSERMGMRFSIESVRLAFPLDLSLHKVMAVEKGDTLLDARYLRLNVKLMPLFKGRADVDGLELYGVRLDSKSYISDTRIKGSAGELVAASHGVDWEKELVMLDRVRLRNADFCVMLSDTAKKDTTQSQSHWNIQVKKADLANARVKLMMPGDSMRIDARLGKLALRGGTFDTGKKYYAVQQLLVRGTDVRYDIPYEKAQRGLDYNHLGLTGISFKLDTLSYNADGVLRAGLTNLALREKCGLQVKQLSGGVYMDSTQLRVPALRLRTSASRIDADVAFDFRSFSVGKGGHCRALVDAEIGYADVQKLAQGYVDRSLLAAFPHKSIVLNGEVSGNIDRLRLPSFVVNVPQVASLKVNGYVDNVLKNWRRGRLNFSLRTQNLASVRRLLPRSLTQSICIPNRVQTKGWVAFRGDVYDTRLAAQMGKGRLQVKAHANLRSEAYQVAATAQSFPIASIVKGVAVSPFSGRLRVSGRGFDVLSSRSSITADVRVDRLAYSGYDLSGIQLNGHLQGGRAKASFSVRNSLINADGEGNAVIGKQGYRSEERR